MYARSFSTTRVLAATTFAVAALVVGPLAPKLAAQSPGHFANQTHIHLSVDEMLRRAEYALNSAGFKNIQSSGSIRWASNDRFSVIIHVLDGNNKTWVVTNAAGPAGRQQETAETVGFLMDHMWGNRAPGAAKQPQPPQPPVFNSWVHSENPKIRFDRQPNGTWVHWPQDNIVYTLREFERRPDRLILVQLGTERPSYYVLKQGASFATSDQADALQGKGWPGGPGYFR
jgi:hypothetical protein